jgi:hydrogenase-4 component B
MISTPEQAVVASIVICITGAVATLIVSRNKTVAGWFAFVFTAATSGLIFYAVAHVLRFGPSPHAVAFWSVPDIGFALRVYVDGLTAVFLTVAAVVALPAAFYSISYMRHYEQYGVARYYPYFLLFLAAMYGLLSTTDMMWFFFIFWQLMTWPGYALIRYEWKKRENIRAANKYLIMMQIACAVTMLGAELLAVGGMSATHNVSLKYDFDTVSARLPALLSNEPWVVTAAFALFLVGFGIKMGMWPFGQVWLPDAHPAAPSPISAMLSGVMIKTGVYGLIRYFLWLLPATSAKDFSLSTWGCVIALLGTITLFSGTMQALAQEHTKRLLAFHSIGQIGYILLGVGTCMALLQSSHPMATSLAAMGLIGALFHVLNHGLFKALLFLNAGSILHATDTQDLNQLGGLMRFMPITAITALVASSSISGVPLFNGFASKWTIYVSAIRGSTTGPARYLAVCAVIAILTSVLTLASFIKFFGTSFLARTSEHVRARATARRHLEVGFPMQISQVALASLCVLLGVVPGLGLRFLQTALERSHTGYGSVLSATIFGWRNSMAAIHLTETAVYTPIALAAVLALTFLLSYGISRLGEAPRRRAEPWLCGYAKESESNRYVAHNFYGETKTYFHWLLSLVRDPRELRHVIPRRRQQPLKSFRKLALSFLDFVYFLLGGSPQPHGDDNEAVPQRRVK